MTAATTRAEARSFAELRAAEVLAAAYRLRGVIVRTPLRRCDPLSARIGGDVFLKLETEQHTGSFKVRGAFNALATMDAELRARGVVASSAGNHGLGLAWAARHFGVPALVFIPSTAPEVKRRGIEALGATIDHEAPDYDAAMRRAKAYAAAHGVPYINPCLGDALIAGQGTVALEILEEIPDVATIVVSVGGAGLLAGTGSLVRRVAPGVRIVGAQSVNTAAMARSLAAGRVVDIESVATLADGLAGGIDDFALDIGRHALDEIATVAEREIASAIGWLAREEGLQVEGAGAASVAALLEAKVRVEPPVAVIVSGRNIDAARHARIVGGEVG